MIYYSHNLHFLADSHMMQGRLADARRAADELAERLTPHADDDADGRVDDGDADVGAAAIRAA